ncbi:hypothetical protein [Hanstruepera marina]|uniref:hypothetical protein n=1 Tax=Hanstruepera marina TaxID=2873265 RepID=UPI001CA72F53|nr:hypothetical protein [Hanstruepera marina]
MTLKYLEKQVVKSFCELDTDHLKSIDEHADYSHNYKDEFIEEMNTIFNEFKSQGINKLLVKPSECKYCHPTFNAYSFYHPISNEFLIRYVISQENGGMYRVDECKNNPLPELTDGMPF